MQLNRLQFKSRYAFRPIVRYDIFKGALTPEQRRNPFHLIGAAETYEQLPLPEVTQPEIQTNIKNFSHEKNKTRTRKRRVRELVYVPYEESA